MPLENIEKKVRENLKTHFVKAIDLRGGDHIQLIVVSENFKNKMLVEQHKIVYDIFSEELKSNQIHALTLKTFDTDKWEEVKHTLKVGVDHNI